MALVVATTVLSTTWSEFDVPAFNAQNLATISSCIDEVEVKLKRGTLGTSTTPSTTQVAQWIARAKEELAETKQFTWRYRFATATTVSGTYRYELPPDYGGGYLALRDKSNDRNIKIIDAHTYNQFYPDMSEENSDEVKFACVKKNELWLGPPPGGAYVLELEYERTGEDNSATDIAWLPEIERWRCVDFATAEAFRSLHQWQEAAVYDQRWREGLAKAVRSDGRKKWSSSGYRCFDFWHG